MIECAVIGCDAVAQGKISDRNGDDFLFSDQDLNGTLFYDRRELLNGGPGHDLGADHTLPDIHRSLETIQFPAAAIATLNDSEFQCDFGVDFVVPMLILYGGPLTPGLNTLTMSNAMSDVPVALPQGTQVGNQVSTVQGVSLNTGLADPVVVAFAETDREGVATVIINVPASQLGQTLLFQAFQVLPEVQQSDVVSLLVGAGRQSSADEESFDAEDVSRDRSVSPLDALIVINHLNATSSESSAELKSLLDVNGDEFISAIDVLRIVNRLNAHSAQNAEGEAAVAALASLGGVQPASHSCAREALHAAGSPSHRTAEVHDDELANRWLPAAAPSTESARDTYELADLDEELATVLDYIAGDITKATDRLQRDW